MLRDPELEARKNQDNDPDFPRMLYRFPGAGADVVVLKDGKYATAIAASTDALDSLLEEGFALTPAAARAAAAAKDEAVKRVSDAAAHEKAVEAARLLLGGEAGPTRSELELKATELGIKFDGRTPDKKLGEQIAAALRH